jgi:low affinity Fe/Cu permease
VALLLVFAYFVFGPALGFPAQPLELGFLITLSTFVLVFLIEHEGYRDNAATQVKLDEIIAALDADRSKIGIEDRPPKEIDSVRDATRAREGERKTRDGQRDGDDTDEGLEGRQHHCRGQHDAPRCGDNQRRVSAHSVR